MSRLTVALSAAAILFLNVVSPAIAVPSESLPTGSAQFFTPPGDSPAPDRAAGGATRAKSGGAVILWYCIPQDGLGCSPWKSAGTYGRAEAEAVSIVYSLAGYRISIRPAS
jgi:hypothetical protein